MVTLTGSNGKRCGALGLGARTEVAVLNFGASLLTNLHQTPTQPHLLGFVPLYRRSRKHGAGQIQECGGAGEQPHE